VKGVGRGVEALDDGRVLYRIGRLLAPRRGPFGVLLDFRAGGLSGFGGGFTAEHGAFFGEGNLFRLHAETTTRGNHRLNLGVRFPASRDGATDFALGFRARPYARYFGVGPERSDDEESFYRQETAWAGASHRRGLGSGVHVQGDVLYSSLSAGPPGTKEHPSIEVEYAGNLPLGYATHSYGWTVGAQLSHENGLGPGRATHGGLRRIRAARFIATSADDARFWSYRGEVQQYLPLFFPYRVLALRGFVSWIESSNGGDVPFQRLFTNDDPDLLRGYEDFRFRDRGMAVLSGEYRWPLWANKTANGSGLDLYLLSDAGQVFHDTNDLGGGNLTFSYGGGLRLESASGFRARLELAWSEEQMMFRLRADQIFQFMKGNLFFGRDPVPDR
jgi:surface antigen Omp85-like protein